MSVAVTRMMPDNAPLLREIRLEALAAHPTYLASDPTYEGSWPLDRWRESLAKAHWLLARFDGEPAGICVFTYPAHNSKQRHTGHVGSMYARDAFKGKGVGDALLQALLDHAATCVEQVALTVTAENVRAIRLYERFGFREYGRIPRSIFYDGRYYDDVEMIRPVSASD